MSSSSSKAAPDAAASFELPDGLEGLCTHNLLTYKSQHEALDGWAIEELIGHYVNYRKLTSASTRQTRLPAEAEFQLYAVATRFPAKLGAGVHFAATPWQGVFDLAWGTRSVRLIVLGAIAKHPRNAPWELFSAEMDRIRHGVAHFRARTPQAAALLHELYFRYQLELPTMAYTLEDFDRDSRRHVLERLTPEELSAFLQKLPFEERLRGLPPEERMRGLPAVERLRGLPAEERLRGLPPEERMRGLPAVERLRGLPPEELRKLKDYLNELDARGDGADATESSGR